MKKNLWVLVLAAIVGFGMVSCEDGNEPDASFDGTWIIMDYMYPHLEAGKVVAANGTWKQYDNVIEEEHSSDSPVSSSGEGGGTTYIPPHIILWDVETYRGTYTVSGNTVTLTATEGNIGFWTWWEESDVSASNYIKDTYDEWKTYASLPDEMKEEMPQTYSGTISGNSFNVKDRMPKLPWVFPPPYTRQ